MKKLIFVLHLFFFLQTTTALAQEEGWQLGLFASEHTFWLYNAWDFNPAHHGIRIESSRLDIPDGWSAGAYAVYAFNPWLSLRIEPNFNWQRQKYRLCPEFSNEIDAISCNLERYDITSSTKLSYISVPVQIQFSYIGTNNSGFYLKGGPQLSFLAAYRAHSVAYHYNEASGFNYFYEEAELKNSTSYYYNRRIVVYDPSLNDTVSVTINGIDYPYKRFVWGLTAGIGWHYRIGNDRGILSFGIRGSYSLSKVEERGAKFRENGSSLWAPSPLALQIKGYKGFPGFDSFKEYLATRPRTHNIRLGLEAGITFFLD